MIWRSWRRMITLKLSVFLPIRGSISILKTSVKIKKTLILQSMLFLMNNSSSLHLNVQELDKGLKKEQEVNLKRISNSLMATTMLITSFLIVSVETILLRETVNISFSTNNSRHLKNPLDVSLWLEINCQVSKYQQYFKQLRLKTGRFSSLQIVST